MKKNIYTLTILILFPTIALSSPAVSSITGTLTPGQSVTISGANFGATGPTVLIYDEFTGDHGQVVSLNATKGTWTTSDSPTYISDVGTNTALLSVDGVKWKQMELAFPGTQEVFVSYKVKIPLGYHFPNTAAPETFAPDSAWKLAWIMDGPDSSPDDDDICLPTFPNGTYFQIAGNDTGIKLNGVSAGPEVGRPGTTSNWFSFKGWNRVSIYLKAGADPVGDTGRIWFQGVSNEFGGKTFAFTNRTIFDGDDNNGDDVVSEWTYLLLSGWHRTGGVNGLYDNMTRAIYDDVYIATGQNAAARVEIGDNTLYESCTKLAIATPEKWMDTSITATIRAGEFSKGDSVYIFVIDENNNPSPGYGPFTLSAPLIKKLQ